jgi:hypothetical protein
MVTIDLRFDVIAAVIRVLGGLRKSRKKKSNVPGRRANFLAALP